MCIRDSYTTLWNLKCSLRSCYHCTVRERNSRINSISTVVSKFARFESSWLQRVGNTAREGVQNMHHESGWTETATENGVDQAGSCCHCSGHSSVASSLAADQWCMFCTPLLQYFLHADINWIQIWWIWRPQLRLDKFWSFSIYQLNCRMCVMSISSFTR